MEELEIKLIKKKDFAELAGVTPGAVTNIGLKLGEAVVGNKININHPNARDYIAQASFRANRSIVRSIVSQSDNRSKTDPSKKNVAFNPDGLLQPDLKVLIPAELAKLTLEEIVDKYGSFPGFNSYVIAQKNLEDLKIKQTKSKVARDELVDKNLLASVILELITLLFTRLVTETPIGLAQRVVSIVKNGAEDSLYLVQCEYQENNSRQLKMCRDELLEHLNMDQTHADTL